MKDLTVKPIPTPSGADHPMPPADVLPKHEFSMGFIGNNFYLNFVLSL